MRSRAVVNLCEGESSVWFLVGFDASTICAIADMICIMLVVGGENQSREKYDDGAMRAVASALRQLDYVEDRGASCVLGRR